MPLAIKDQPSKIASAISVSLPPETRSFVLKDKYDRVLQIDKSSKMETGFTLMSTKTVSLVLRCTLKNRAGKTVWETTVGDSGSKDNPKGWWAGLGKGAGTPQRESGAE